MRPSGLALLLALAPALAPALVPMVANAAGQTASVDQAWARATAPGQDTGVVYATLLSPAGDRLLSVASPACSMAMLHENVVHGSMTAMQPLQTGLALPPSQPVHLAPGGIHIMLMGLKQPLVAGDHVPLALTFAHAGTLTVSVPIEPLGAAGPPP